MSGWVEVIEAFIGGIVDSFTFKSRYYDALSQLDEARFATEELKQKLIAANEVIYQLQKTDGGKAQTIIERDNLIAELNSQLEEKIGQIADLNGGIESLKTQLALSGDMQTLTPQFMDETKAPYVATRQVLNSAGSMESYQVTNAQDMFAIFEFVKKKVTDNGWQKLGKHEKLIAVWAWTIRARQYVSDFLDNWQFSCDTYYRHKGDCEDSSILFVVMCRAVGINPTEVFLACGPTQFGYHAFPIVYYSAQEATAAKLPAEGWYIFESTLYSPSTNPVQLTKTTYEIDAGLQNWKYAGMIRPEYAKKFNVPTGGEMEMKLKIEQRPIDNSEKKRRQIQEYWDSLTR